MFQINYGECQDEDHDTSSYPNYDYGDVNTTTTFNPDYSDETTLDPYVAYCEKMSEEISSMKEILDTSMNTIESSCCKVPDLNIFGITQSDCKTYCEIPENRYKYNDSNPYINPLCCMIVCVFTKSGFLFFSEDPNIKPELSFDGLLNSIKISDDYDEAWAPIIEISMRRCYDDCYGMQESYGYYCEVVPKLFKPISSCSIKENFLKCPDHHWNSKNLKSCDKARVYVKECIADSF